MPTCDDGLVPDLDGCDDGAVSAVGVLGRLEVLGPGGPVRIGSARQRQLLVALAAHAGHVVATDVLVELLWPDPPVDPAGALQTNVSRLRRLLPPGSRIETAADGYRLVVDPGVLDVTAFADHLAAGPDDPRRYAQALRLWRGTPFADLDHPALQPEVARLVELRAVATERYAAALLAAGRAGEAVAALEVLVRADPLREGAVALLMRALVATDRRAEALAVFARLRARLADELGLDPAPELRELERRVLRQELARGSVEPARPPPSPWPGLPVSSFVGRDREIGEVSGMLAEQRVVTLCGPGGVGKTRLALHVAAEVAGRYDDGVVLVELGEIAPGSRDAVHATAAALRLSGGAEDPLARIVEFLAVRRLLLVVDNCEHVADEAAALVEAIARGAPGVDLLLTSREPLRVDAERVVVVAPLGLDAAAALLADRLAAAGGACADPDLLPELCRRLDGLPLALELAAGRAATLGIPALLEALDSDGAFELLRGGRRTAAARHRSLGAVVAWSYGLLDDPQRELFERLAVFAGPVERAAVVDVCWSAEALPDLVERSLVVRHPGSPDRFGMLETLRAFGRSRLARDRTAASAAGLRARHAAWAVRLAAEVDGARWRRDEPAAIRRFDGHLADLRRAHAWLCTHGPVPALLRMSALFGELAFVRGRLDLLRPVENALAAVGVPEPGGPVRAAHPLVPRLLGLVATSGWQRGDLELCAARGRQAIAVAEASGDRLGTRYGHEALCTVAAFRGDLDECLREARLAHELGLEAGDPESTFLTLIDLSVFGGYAGAADAGAYEAELVARRPESATGRAWVDYVRGETRADRGDPDAARLLAAAVAAAEEADSGFVAGIARHTLLTAAARDGDPAAALPAFGALLDHWHGYAAWTQLWIAVRALAGTLSALGRHREAAVLLGALGASPRATSVFGADSARLAAVEEAARAALGVEYVVAAAEGARLGDRGAIALARRLTRA
ncbi:BTAD domain-containing putative transcriptional regulator [Pseudonocardia sp.]|uniref:BTAD domain-containing putative transcriptional regulator n=1 Tax=Pseudonocardia sp. TaxID=60912 RepID=UPI003D13FBAA